MIYCHPGAYSLIRDKFGKYYRASGSITSQFEYAIKNEDGLDLLPERYWALKRLFFNDKD